nr:tyrosine-type recombinase/integrase [uncultured Marvinbryantia sp.]
MDYVCCSSYGRPRSKSYHYEHYVKLIEAAGVPYITFHDLRHTYTTILMKNNINQRAIAAALGHSKSIITVDTYTDMKMIIEDCVEEMQEFISEIHPYDATDKYMLEEMFQEKIDLDESEKVGGSINYIPGITIYDYSDVEELEDIAEWYMGEGMAV